ncbi:GntR family transcriptional regulator [Dactylosporangium sp. CA-092794]|uniref:GntR family transcriptional regulator n=1 Tax=Dactylosporangium sp. CA-092794 TaxID=3239929 RepID=UPI003D908E61
MVIPSRPHNGYRKIAEVLRQRIHDGSYPPGDPVPTEAALADAFACSRDTVRDALAALEVEGHILKQRGRRTIVRRRADRTRVEIPPNAWVSARPVTLPEAESFGCGPGIAMIEVHTGTTEQLYRGDQHILVSQPAAAA